MEGTKGTLGDEAQIRLTPAQSLLPTHGTSSACTGWGGISLGVCSVSYPRSLLLHLTGRLTKAYSTHTHLGIRGGVSSALPRVCKATTRQRSNRGLGEPASTKTCHRWTKRTFVAEAICL